MNLTKDSLHRYLEVFNNTYVDTACSFLEEVHRARLAQYPLIQLGATVGYISTQFGAGFEYFSYRPKGITIRSSYRRIEDLFTMAPRRVQRLPTFVLCKGSNITISGLTFDGGFPFRLDSEDSSVRLISARFSALGWARNVEYAELSGNRTQESWSEANAVARAKDAILVALLDLRQAQKRSISLDDYLTDLKKNLVLVLGDFSIEGRKRLDAIKAELTGLHYYPITLDEVPESVYYDLTQKAVAVGSVSRFVVVDDSSKAGHLIEFSHADINRWVTIILRLEGTQGTFATHGRSLYSKVMIECEYSSDNLLQVLEDSAKWAENKIAELARGLNSLYPWRK